MYFTVLIKQLQCAILQNAHWKALLKHMNWPCMCFVFPVNWNVGGSLCLFLFFFASDQPPVKPPATSEVSHPCSDHRLPPHYAAPVSNRAHLFVSASALP